MTASKGAWGLEVLAAAHSLHALTLTHPPRAVPVFRRAPWFWSRPLPVPCRGCQISPVSKAGPIKPPLPSLGPKKQQNHLQQQTVCFPDPFRGRETEAQSRHAIPRTLGSKAELGTAPTAPSQAPRGSAHDAPLPFGGVGKGDSFQPAMSPVGRAGFRQCIIIMICSAPPGSSFQLITSLCSLHPG